ncbi:Mg2+ transporter protein, CorA-like/Zinc transport protein ZntB [Penicillium occitanis (nom. inval.)]|nr:Mg2+ transporter protein, CorA-like/Zinc transport protein ZntB [Penicillium occitanis (nom. inval.)]PCH08001.1 hypothetical protein PENOC_016820 [Penicillium occitanis (nom. inval.)]
MIHHHRSLYSEFEAMGLIANDEQKSRQKLFRIIQEKLYISDKDMAAKRARATSLNERLHNEINLVCIFTRPFINCFPYDDLFANAKPLTLKAYHVVTQKSNQLSIKLASIARRDNATMKALALIGVLYLPGTFISGIFGMSFFNYNPPNNNSAEWMMSDKFWIYWAITIPVTIFTVMLWAMLDETVEMYKKSIKKVKFALQDMWDDLPRFKRRQDDQGPSTNNQPMRFKV